MAKTRELRRGSPRGPLDVVALRKRAVAIRWPRRPIGRAPVLRLSCRRPSCRPLSALARSAGRC